MPLRFKNPYFKPAAQAAMEARAANAAPLVDAWLKANPTNRMVTIGELRAALPAIAADLDRATFNQVCHQLGLEIENPGEADA